MTRSSRICRGARSRLLGADRSGDGHHPRPIAHRRLAVERQPRQGRQHRLGRLRPDRDVHRRGAGLAAARRDPERTRTTLRTFAERQAHEQGWFYHWVNVHTGAREWQSEVSSIDTALLMGGVLSVRQCFASDPKIRASPRRLPPPRFRLDAQRPPDAAVARLAARERDDRAPLDAFSEASMLYLLGLGLPTHPLRRPHGAPGSARR